MRCFIFSSAVIEDYSWLEKLDFSNSFIICADGGIQHTKRLGLVADVWMGDGDSLGENLPYAKEIFNFPPEKDNTDTDLAIMLALERGFKDITLIGGLGGRLDHEYSHFCLLKKITDSGAEGRILDKKNSVTMKNRSFVMKNCGQKYVSFFPFGGDVTNFSVKGLKYECENIQLKCGEVQASSNCFDLKDEAEISFDHGYVLVICSED